MQNVLGGREHEEWLGIDVAIGAFDGQRQSAQLEETHGW